MSKLSKITVDMPRIRTTRGAVLYGRQEGSGLPFSNLYVRKDALIREGVKDFPERIRVTVEVLD